jgi:photosystem II stability/assembly factor-like uncharacterized protein
MDGAVTTAGGSGGSATWRGRAIITAACLSVLLAACGQSPAAGGRPSANQPGGGAAAARPGVTTAAPAPVAGPVELIDLMDLSGPGFGLAGLGTGPQAGGYARLVASADFGRSFTAIGPRTAAWTVTDDVFFLGRRDGWFAVFNTGTLAETLYRTADGGRTWHGYAAPGHNMAGGSSDIVQFLTPDRGWLVSISATAPAESLYSTTDGGISWHLVASMPLPHGQGTLPELGQVRFGPGGRAGWLGGGICSHALYRTGDGGRTWQQAGIPAPARSWFGLPAASGRTLLEQVSLPSGTLVLYRSTDGGARWSQASALPGATTAPSACGPAVPVSLPAPQAGWATAVHAARTVVYRTTDGGRHWEKITSSWPVPPGTGTLPVIQATDATHAWLLTAGSMRIYATADGGATWRRIDTAATTAGP